MLFKMSDLIYRILISIIALAIAIGVKKFVPLEVDENHKSQILLLVLFFLLGTFIERKAFSSFKSFAIQLLKTVLAVIALILFFRIIELLPL